MFTEKTKWDLLPNQSLLSQGVVDVSPGEMSHLKLINSMCLKPDTLTECTHHGRPFQWWRALWWHHYTKARHYCHVLHLLSPSLLKTCSLVCSSMQKSGRGHKAATDKPSKASYWVLSVSVSSYDWVTGRGSVRKEAWHSVHQSAFCNIWIKNWLPQRVQNSGEAVKKLIPFYKEVYEWQKCSPTKAFCQTMQILCDEITLKGSWNKFDGLN